MSGSAKRPSARRHVPGIVAAIVASSALLLALALRWHSGERTNDAAVVSHAPVHTAGPVSPAPSNAGDPEHSTTSTPGVEPASPDIKDAYDALFSGDGGRAIDQFILQHLPEAEAGNRDSALYVGDALRMCFLDMRMLQLTLTMLSPDGEDLKELSDHQDIVMKSVAARPAFYKEETRRHMERAIACERLGKDARVLQGEGYKWEAIAAELGNPIARARSIMSISDDGTTDDTLRRVREDQLRRAKVTILDALKESRDLEVLLQASDIVSTATGRDRTLERVAWALVACEYDDCEKLNPRYRSVCEVQGASYCSDEMSDRDYLMLRYPAQYDTASGRAMEIRDALDNERWEELGLQ